MLSLYSHRCVLEKDLITDVFKSHWRLVFCIIFNVFKLNFKNRIKGVLKHEFRGKNKNKKEKKRKGIAFQDFWDCKPTWSSSRLCIEMHILWPYFLLSSFSVSLFVFLLLHVGERQNWGLDSVVWTIQDWTTWASSWAAVSLLAPDDTGHAFWLLSGEGAQKPWIGAWTPDPGFPVSQFSCIFKSFCVTSAQSV